MSFTVHELRVAPAPGFGHWFFLALAGQHDAGDARVLRLAAKVDGCPGDLVSVMGRAGSGGLTFTPFRPCVPVAFGLAGVPLVFVPWQRGVGVGHVGPNHPTFAWREL